MGTWPFIEILDKYYGDVGILINIYTYVYLLLTVIVKFSLTAWIFRNYDKSFFNGVLDMNF